MRHLKLLALCAALHAFYPSAQAGEKVWISLGDAAYAQLQKHVKLPAAASATVAARVVGDTSDASVHLVQVDEEQLMALSHSVHEELGRCGGFMFHASQAEGLATLQRNAGASNLMRAQAAATRPSYAIDQQSVVNPMLSQMQASNIGQTIVDLSTNFVNRYYNSSAGVASSNWLKNRWTTLANGRSDITVEQFAHPNWQQKSVIATIKGSDVGGEVVVLGGHLDSINKAGTNETTVAPGADDDASGVASLTEVLRVLAASNYKPRRTLKFMAYAAEEVGLRGSQEIARSFATAGTNVVGVMQLDMTNFKGSVNDIYFVTDYTDSAQTTFASDLVKTYLPTLRVGSGRCGYACSDHASWNGQGFAASFPFEADPASGNRNIHTANDTFASTGNQADHALKFSRLALAYMVELGSGDGAVPPPAEDKTETFQGSLALRQMRVLGPFKVAAGSVLKSSTTGTGDIDLYVKLGSAPTTSDYGCRSYSPSAAESCTLNVAANSDAYVMVRGYSAGSYNLGVTYRPASTSSRSDAALMSAAPRQ